MKNKIKKFSKGDFSIRKPDIIFEETRICFSVGEGEVYKGSFKLHNCKDGDIRGLVYPSSFRVQLMESGFEGHEVEVRFSYDGTGLKPGHVEQGKFTVVCNGGEYELSFTAIIEKPFLMTKYGKVQTIRDFKQLAFHDFSEAQRLFRSRDFYEVLKYEEPRVLNLYSNMRKWSLGEQALEEFLVGTKMKECLFLSLSSTEKVCEDIIEETKESVTLTKNTWGFMPIAATVEGEFLHIDKVELTTDDFVGSSYVFEYLIRHHKLHAGNNFGRIIFETPYETIEYPIEVSQHGIREEDRREPDFLMAKMIKQYLACVGGTEDLLVWAKNSIAALEIIKKKKKNSIVYQLMQAHVYFCVGKKEEAQWILENYNYNRMNNNKNSKISAYYLYLTTLLHETTSHLNRVVDEIQKLYIRNPHSWEMLCMLANIDPQYKNYERRLHVLERQFYSGANQIVFYLQAFDCYMKDQSTLKKLGAFEIQVLNFASKYKLMTKELALYTANLAGQQKSFDRQLYKILERAFTTYRDPMILTAICTLLIKGNRTETLYFKWYQKAVKQELKIVQLYEYYMMSIDEHKVRGAFPQSVYLYFMHGNVLNYRKAALLYSNIVTYQESNAELYTHYREEIVRFTWEQLEKRHIDDFLRVLYKRYCVESEMTPKRVRALYDICHSYEVNTRMTGMKYVMVIEKDGGIEQRVPCIDNRAQVCLYDREPRIIWESRNGRHYTDSIPYETKRLFYEPRLMDMCRNLLDDVELEGHENEVSVLSFDALRMFGIDQFEEKDVFDICSKRIREENYEEDDFLIYLCFELFRRGQYDKVILTYLTNYFCGATSDMKRLWYVARGYDIGTHKLAERIITQMVFSENMFREEEIFAGYYMGGPYFRLKQAYLAYVSKEYVVNDRRLDPCIFAIIAREYEEKEDMADICKVAVLKYYANEEMEQEQEPMLNHFLKELCEKQLIFPFYMQYKVKWLREVQLYDKYIVEYRSEGRGKVEIEYQISQGERDSLEYQQERLMPMYGNVYVKIFVLYQDECLRYSFKETGEDGYHESVTSKRLYKPEGEIPKDGIYGRLNSIGERSGLERKEGMQNFCEEMRLAQEIFSEY